MLEFTIIFAAGFFFGFLLGWIIYGAIEDATTPQK
jgi:hypothetical protein